MRKILILVLTFVLTSCGWIVKESNDASLKSLSTSSGSLSPAFSSKELNYTDTIANDTIVVTSASNHESAQLLINVNDGPHTLIASGENVDVELQMGVNTILVTVVAEDGGAKQTYTIKVTRS